MMMYTGLFYCCGLSLGSALHVIYQVSYPYKMSSVGQRGRQRIVTVMEGATVRAGPVCTGMLGIAEVSEQRFASILRVKASKEAIVNEESRTWLCQKCRLNFYQIKRCHIQEDSDLQRRNKRL
jgi:hypothetical protein